MAKLLNPQRLFYVAEYEFSGLLLSMCFWLCWSLAFFSYFNAEFNLLVAAALQFGLFQKRMVAHCFMLTVHFLHILTEAKIVVMNAWLPSPKAPDRK